MTDQHGDAAADAAEDKAEAYKDDDRIIRELFGSVESDDKPAGYRTELDEVMEVAYRIKALSLAVDAGPIEGERNAETVIRAEVFREYIQTGLD